LQRQPPSIVVVHFGDSALTGVARRRAAKAEIRTARMPALHQAISTLRLVEH